MSLSFRGFASCLGAFLVVVSLGKSSVQAAWLGFRNDSSIPVLVQSSCLVREKPRPLKFQTLYPGEVAWQSIVHAGLRKILIQEATTPSNMLLQATILCGSEDQFFSFQFIPPGPAKFVAVKKPRAQQ